MRRPEIFQGIDTAEEATSRPWLRWAAWVAGAAVVLGGIGFGARQLLTTPARVPVAAPPAKASAPQSRTGTLRVKSTPDGAEVFIDGKGRGPTPLTASALAPGRHTVEIRSSEGTISRSVVVAAGETTEVDEAIYAGWVAVYAPFDVTVSEKGQTFNADDRNQILLRPGSHQLRIANAGLGYEDVRTVDIKPGQVTTLTVAPPQSSVTVTASTPAEVWIDGAHAGTTPVWSFPVSVGTHELVIRTNGTERTLPVTVTTHPTTINLDSLKPGA